MATLTLRSVKGTPLTVAELDANFTSLNNAYGAGNITSNVAIGNYALNSNSTGSNNTSIGVNALYGNTTGSYNLSVGTIAGRYIADGTTSATILNNSTFIGYGTRASANSITNETVIGYNAIGSGSNSVTLGGSTVTKTIIPFGNVGIGTSSPDVNYKLEVVQSANIKNAARFRINDPHTAAGYNYGVNLQNNDTTVNNYTALSNADSTGTSNAWIEFTNVAHSAVTPQGTIGFNTRNGANYARKMTIDMDGNVGIGTTAPNASAILDAQSTTKGVRFPNMTTTQKNAIASPAAGLVVFDTTLAKLCLYTGVAWQTITSV